jgi:nucleoside-diphosphate-sugar epimerase
VAGPRHARYGNSWTTSAPWKGLSARKPSKSSFFAAGDVPDTHANVEDLAADFGYKPAMPMHEGGRNFVKWHKGYFGV